MKRNPTSSAFTLIELSVAIGIIVLLMAIAVPAYRFIVGNRSTEAASNLIEAMLGRARGKAIADQRYVGVAFFIDPKDGRTALAIVVEKPPLSTSEEDPYLNYKAWHQKLGPDGSNSGNATSYLAGHEVVELTRVQDDDLAFNKRDRMVPRRYFATSNHTSGGNPASGSGPWALMPSGKITFDLLDDGDAQSLPEGVGCQLINDLKGPNSERYLQTGCIVFDPQGNLASVDMSIMKAGAMGTRIGLFADVPPGPNDVLKSQLGVVLFDAEAFRGKRFTSGDLIVPLPLEPGQPTVAKSGEDAEEAWLDENALQLLVGRHDGTLLRGE